MIRTFILFLLTVSFSRTIFSQKAFKVLVLNKKSEPIPYCTVGWNRGYALSTNDSGFVIIADRSQIKDSILITTIGYKSKIVLQSQINDLEDIRVHLDEEIIQLPEITVGKRNFVKTIGCLDKKEGYSYITNLSSSSICVTRFFNDYSKGGLLNKASFFIAKKSKGRQLFRIRLFYNDNGLPGKDMISENLIIPAYEINEWNHFLLDTLNIQLPENGFFLGMEWLSNMLNKESYLGLGESDTANEVLTYIRRGNESWKKYLVKSPKGRITNCMINLEVKTF